MKPRQGTLILGVLLLACGSPSPVVTEDWPQFLGPRRDGIYRGRDLAPSWPDSGPALLWKREVGEGFSAPAVVASRLVLFHRLADRETVECLDAGTGKPVWRFDYATTYRDDFGFDEGPRATPTIGGGSVYTLGAQGALHCLDLATGERVWRVDTAKKFGAAKGFFGFACSPLLEGERVLLNIGGAGKSGLIALDRKTGKVAWAATDHEASYSSPVAATIGGERHAFFFTRKGLVDVDPATGKVRFDFFWRARAQASVNAATPLVLDDRVFISSSYGVGAALLRVEDGAVERIWSSDDALTNHYATSVHRDGYLYGFHGRQEHTPDLRCIDAATGKVSWSEDGIGAGTILLAGDRLLILMETGKLILALASEKKFQPVGSARILEPTVRAFPALANGVLYARSEDRLVAVDLRPKK